ncbi:hypothetical protein [Rhodococcus sp. HNM0569]|uniref:AMIN-like domain-containing (lipo)protein n=1 Tax=Rhodococcus sp. HNM0569 TaxID=2716340 RepID=UPI00146F8A13|nr:hypothetical protein [Rhodococcus sp. HNM0569]NLU83928.1 hypothetical protein [Rhodococcus sp. HNM0569]
MITTRRALPIAVTAAALVALTSCSSDPTPDTTAAPMSTTEAAASTEPSDSAPTDASPKSAAPSAGAKLTVTDVRVGSHGGFDRVVYEMAGTGTPGFRAQYVPEAVQDGSGRTIPVDGAAILQVQIDGSAYPFDTGVEGYTGPDPVPGTDGGSVASVNGALVFEGVTQSFVGVNAADLPFSVTTLADPPRVVVDVAH